MAQVHSGGVKGVAVLKGQAPAEKTGLVPRGQVTAPSQASPRPPPGPPPWPPPWWPPCPYATPTNIKKQNAKAFIVNLKLMGTKE